MAIEVIPYTDEWVTAVLAFNDRMHAGGTHWGWYGQSLDDWLPIGEGRRTWREHWLALEDGTTVRGAFALKPQEWRIRGTSCWPVDWQGPVTEGFVDRRYNTLGLRLLREMLKKHPMLYSWGHGGLEVPILQMLEKLGWLLHKTPFCLRIVRPTRFLLRNGYLRTDRARRLALDAVAFSGAGEITIRALHAARALGARSVPAAELEEFDRFEAWTDEVWERCADSYDALAARDSGTMNALLPPGRWPPGIRLRVRLGDRTLGWVVVLDTQMENEPRFGTLRLGSIIDCLAEPRDADVVIGAAFRFLRARGVDLVISNQSHPAWIAALEKHGFLALADRRVFAASPELVKALAPFEETSRALHLTNMDGHGPMGL